MSGDNDPKDAVDPVAAGLVAAMTLLERELERLHLDLDTQRLRDQPNQETVLQQLIADIEYRQNTLDGLKQSLAAQTIPR